jgi:energy-coupling factor transporter ATP-binding protein EcfA2
VFVGGCNNPFPLFEIADLTSLHTRLQETNPNPNWYSNPQNINPFPFPFVYNQLPVGRFYFSGPPELSFVYMGRESFSAVWSEVNGLKIREGFTRLYIHGTMGYGKSHLLAVLAGLLSRSGKRTVYLPDCREFLANKLRYMQTALLCAFADPSSSDERDRIRGLESQEDIIYFCDRQMPMYFIVDQMNALDREDANMDTKDNERKAATQIFLNGLTYGQYRITSASASHRTAVHMAKKQTNDSKLALMGGMSEVSKCSSRSFVVSFPSSTRDTG